MKEEYLPAEYRTQPRNKTVLNALRNSSLNYKVSIFLIFFAVILNISLIVSIPAQAKNFEIYYLIKDVIVGYDSRYVPLSVPPVPVLRFDLTYTTSFHIQYWIMIGIYTLVGSGLLLKSESEIKLLTRSFYVLVSVVFLVGAIKAMILVFGIRYYVLDNILELAIFLTILPFILCLPLHLLIRANNHLISNSEDEKLQRKKLVSRIIFYSAYTVLVGFVYIGVQFLIS